MKVSEMVERLKEMPQDYDVEIVEPYNDGDVLIVYAIFLDCENEKRVLIYT